MSKRPKVTTLEATAYHEAAHAFVCVERRLPFKYVTIEPRETDDSLGHLSGVLCPRVVSRDFRNLMPKRLEDYIMVVLAGAIAEGTVRGRRNHIGASNDYELAIEVTSVIFFDRKVAIDYLRFIATYLESWLEPISEWEHSPWAKVTAIANALLERKTLSAKMVREIVAGKHRQTEVAA